MTAGAIAWTCEPRRALKDAPDRPLDESTAPSDGAADTERSRAWRCRACGQRVAECGAEWSPTDGATRFVFANPAGRVFEIVTLSAAPGAKAWGEPTLEHTWFPDHLWRMLSCAGCGRHLGWAFEPVGTTSRGFVGLSTREVVQESWLV